MNPTPMNTAGSSRRRPLRTSLSHPLRIDVLPASPAPGEIGLSFCPGKKAPSASGGDWDRDLGLDIDVVAAWKPKAVVTLVEHLELAMLGVPTLGASIQARGIEWHHLPIADVQPPDSRFETQWAASGPRLLQVLRAGGRVLVHCRGGLGRAGTVSARLLIELGASPADAIRRVRQARPGAIETDAQERYVFGVAGLVR